MLNFGWVQFPLKLALRSVWQKDTEKNRKGKIWEDKIGKDFSPCPCGQIELARLLELQKWSHPMPF